jgi:hypothetical protein
VHNLLLAMQLLDSQSEVMHVGGGDDHRMDQARILDQTCEGLIPNCHGFPFFVWCIS